MKAFVSHTRLTAIILLFSLRIAPATDAAKMEDFIPNDSVVYLTLRDLDEVWEAIEVSENWEGVLASPKIKTQMDQVNQGANMLKLMLGIDLRGIIEMVGHQISLTVFPGEVGPMIGIIVNTSGAIREVERIVTGFAQMASASEDNSVEQNAGKYRKVEFSIVTLDELELTYGFVGDLLVVGVNPGSFEALIDTYRKQRESISKNDQFRDLYQQFAEAQVFVYTNVDLALPLVTADMDAQKEAEFRALGLDSLQTLVYSLDLLNVGGEHQLYAKIKPDQRQGILGSLLQEAQPLQSIQALSGKEDVFLSIAPSNAEAIWELIETVANTGDDSGGFYDGIAQVEALLNLNIKTDVVGALTGEVALWGTFTEGMAEDVHSLTDLLYEMDAAIIVALRSQAKWRTFLDSIQNLANMPIQQYDYKGTMLHQVSLPPEDPTMTVRYGYVKDLFLVSFSDERFELVVDNASAGRAVSTFKKKFKALPADPVIFLQLKLDKFLMAILASGEESIRLSADATKRLGEIGPLVASVSVKQNEAWLKVGTMSAEEPIETYGKLASAIAPAIIR
ncbi:MAG: DUF3352 domain-containing protein [Candidatus Poribacteria bacterium]|nr:DUF3352 domain-containing protein [Candidatus Poribacteria bacterium]